MLTVISIAVLVSRYIRTLTPLWGYVPPQWRWLPPALVAALGLLSERLTSASSVQDAVDVALQAVVIVALAATGGVHAPEVSSGK